MEKSLLERVKALEDSLEPLIERIKNTEFTKKQTPTNLELRHTMGRLELLPKFTDEQILFFLESIRLLPVKVEDDLSALIEHLKSHPKQKDEELRLLIRALKNLPLQSQDELEVLVEHLRCFPEHTEQELISLVDHIQYLPKRVVTDSRMLSNRIERATRLSDDESRAIIIEIWHREELSTEVRGDLIAFIERMTLINHLQLVESIKFFDKDPRDELIALTNLVKSSIPTCAKIILFGSYAKGTEVRYDENYVDGVLTTYQSDFDIMVVTRTTLTEPKLRGLERLLRFEVTRQYNDQFVERRHAPPQFIVEGIERLTSFLKRKQCFFTEIITEGVVLYDSGDCSLPEPQKLSFREIKENAEALFSQCIAYADEFLVGGYIYLKRDFYGMGAFMSHQACEKYYNAMGMVFDNFNPKLHDLIELINKSKKYSRDLAAVFPRSTDFERGSFRRLCDAYVHARYDIRYTVKKEELEYILTRIEVLKEITYRLCRERLAEYDQKMIEAEK